MSTRRIRIIFSYEGTNYCGWQRQKEQRNTIQEVFESRMARLANMHVNLVASGRTDAGVHARVQVLHADVPTALADRMEKESRGETFQRFKLALNQLLPPDIRILKVDSAPKNFHAQMGVEKKCYVYFINPNQVIAPHLRNYMWHLRLPLDWDGMNRAARYLIGEHDFKAFCAADGGAKTSIRTVFEAGWGEVDMGPFSSQKVMAFRITGNGFLKQMVRSIVGALAAVGNGRAKPEDIKQLLIDAKRKQVGHMAPAHGLWLWDIQY